MVPRGLPIPPQRQASKQLTDTHDFAYEEIRTCIRMYTHVCRYFVCMHAHVCMYVCTPSL